MFSIPEKYRKDASISKVTFVRGASLAGSEKKRFEKSVEEIKLMYQIEGFDIPNLVNDEYNCQVIMFLRVKINELKQSNFVSKIMQKCINPLCVIEFTDGIDCQYSFADKRLNRQDEKDIVIESEYITDTLPFSYQNDKKTVFSLYIDYETILNRNNKHTYYLEMMTKAFLVCNSRLYSKANVFLDSKLWYDDSKLLMCFPLLKQLKTLKMSALKTKTIAERSVYNRQIKETIKQLEDLLV